MDFLFTAKITFQYNLIGFADTKQSYAPNAFDILRVNEFFPINGTHAFLQIHGTLFWVCVHRM